MIDIDEQRKQATLIAINIAEEMNRKNIPPNVAQAAVGSLWTALVYSIGWTKAEYIEMCVRSADAQWEDSDE